MKAIIDHLNFIKAKNFWSEKNSVKRMGNQTTDWEEIFTKSRSDKGLLSKTYKELLIFNTKKTNNPIRKWGKYFNRQVTKEDKDVK